jgi:hypothetical protein
MALRMVAERLTKMPFSRQAPVKKKTQRAGWNYARIELE